jgi:hypothetical protein
MGESKHLVIRKSKQLLPQPVSIFDTPFFGQESDDLVLAFEEGGAVAPDAVRCVAVLD